MKKQVPLPYVILTLVVAIVVAFYLGLIGRGTLDEFNSAVGNIYATDEQQQATAISHAASIIDLNKRLMAAEAEIEQLKQNMYQPTDEDGTDKEVPASSSAIVARK